MGNNRRRSRACEQSDLAGDTGKRVYYYCALPQPLPFMSAVVKTKGDPASFAPAIRQAVREVDPNQPVHRLKTMQHLEDSFLAPRKFVVRLLGFFALAALFMAALGLYGVISYSVTQRMQEIPIRMALGAERVAIGLGREPGVYAWPG